ncbi:bifunctional DNA primase/polymerase [Streptomyces wuyuanensis]|uniref:bifunctional DNA primase/polymerase n=1 Tax=Streptomyces wuyuanensis TaxID=1196353 RepID=UPI003436C2B2
MADIPGDTSGFPYDGFVFTVSGTPSPEAQGTRDGDDDDLTDDHAPSCIETGTALIKRGFVVIPLDHPSYEKCRGAHGPKNPCDLKRGKHPLGPWAESKGFPSACRTAEDVYSWASGRSVNWGVLTGPSNLVVLDEDEPGDMAILCGKLGILTPDTLSVTSGREGGGRHYYFRPPADYEVRNTVGLGGYKIDVRGNGGIAIAAGSTHQTGAVYHWADETKPIMPLPDAIIGLLKGEKDRRRQEKIKLRESGVPTQRAPREKTGAEVGRHDETVRWAGTWRELAIPLTEAKRKLRIIWSGFDQPADKALYTWDEALADLEDVYDRYPEGLKPATDEEMALIKSMSRQEIDALPPQERQRADDLLDEEEARKRNEARLIREREQHHYADIVGKQLAQKRWAEEQRVEEPDDDFGAIFDQLTSDDNIDRRPKFGYIADDDCGLFYEGTTNGIYGKSGIGKSLILARLHVEAMRAGKNVVHWEYDNNSTKMIIQKLVDAGATRDMVVNQFKILRAEGDLETLDSGYAHEVGLVTLDAILPAISALGGDVNQPGGVDMALRTFMQPFTVRGAVGFFIGHVGHQEQDRQAGSHRLFGAMQGSVYLAEVIRQPQRGDRGLVTLTLKKDNQGEAGEVNRLAAYVTYDSTHDDGKLRVHFTRERDQKIIQDEAAEEYAGRKQRAANAEELEKRTIWRLLQEAGEAMNVPTIHTKLADMKESISEKRIKVRLEALVADGIIFIDQAASTGSTKRGGRPSKHFRATSLPRADY